MRFFESLKKAVALLIVVFSLLFVFVNPSYADSTPQIDFTGDWQENVTDKLVPGGKFIINYDENRLPARRTSYRGLPSWEIQAVLQFEGDDPVTFKLLRTGQNQHVTPQEVSIPADAKEIILWFENYGYDPYDTAQNNNARYYDSNYSQNYHFPLTKSAS
ncbi:hypothetical protein H6G81_32575 [Scytonema hofmannii FACHB-248]|uniref:Uncharacterized protein n=1 Tax=Scytonema hofmannii FACHB-248 TaxID=1842502 RepID=A0ABR8H114_9CYAN|nr:MULTISPECIES: DUF6209 family protein [Nostocales]MBD2609127.1 hypothetical protein [Scytonema hofmannii FACHB-248]